MRQYLDRLTNQLTMYRLMLYLLSIMAGIALILSFVDVLQFNPLSMFIGLILLVITSIVVNYLFAYIFSVRAHGESALISALILFFIFSPPRTPSSFIVMILVAAIAMASKYLLVWRSRHIFNPSAVAAVISGVIGLQYASWWVATGPLIPITLLFGTLILYKTRRFKMGTLYVGVSIVVILLVTALNGRSPMDVLPLIFTSWPLLFFAGFMLSEPLTLPPRKYQRYALAVGVAILANAHIAVLGLSFTPEIALVIGNIAAFLCGSRGTLRFTFLSRKQLAKDQVEYIFTSNRRLQFLPGQYIELQFPQKKADARGSRRMFTIISEPGESKLRLATRHYHPSSTYKNALLHMPINAKLTGTGIYGDFILPKDSSQKLLFIAGGIGITPFYAHLQSLLASGEKRSGVLLYSVRSDDDVIYKEVLHAKEHGIQTHIIIGPIDNEILKKHVSNIAEYHVYISGPPSMVDDISQLVRQNGAKKITRDYFSGY
jgi:ferredoxin-NADP reductase